MKKHFKIGLATIVPIAFVLLVINWLYGTFNNIMLKVLPSSWGWQWWYVIVFVVALAAAIWIVGIIFSLLKPIQWMKRKFEEWIIARIPVVNKLYSFGLEISDALIEDGKFDGAIKVVETLFAGQATLGLLTDEKNALVFVPTAPNPLNGFVFKAKEYHIVKMTVEEFIKMLTSLGKLGGDKWK